MFSFLEKLRRPRVDPQVLRRIEQMGYRVTKAGAVECATCASYCGQCGSDHSAPSVDAFLAREAAKSA